MQCAALIMICKLRNKTKDLFYGIYFFYANVPDNDALLGLFFSLKKGREILTNCTILL